MIRQVIKIDEEKCNGCGICATACHEGAIEIIDGKAKLMRDDFCDGFGDCLPGCPTGAISFETREAAEYNEAAVQESKKKKEILLKAASGKENFAYAEHTGCPGTRLRRMIRNETESQAKKDFTREQSMLSNWPVQIKLAPINAPYFDGAKLLIAADCTAYAYASFHKEFIKNHIVLIGCPKLDEADYSEKLTHIIAANNITGITIVRMEVPCCGGLQMAAETALRESGKFIPWQVKTISIEGEILD